MLYEVITMIFGSRKFSVSIFKIAPGIDDGEIIDTTEFTYTDRDDIGSSYLKVSLCAADMILNAVESGKIFLKGTEQNHENARHLPQRLPEDGAIVITSYSIHYTKLYEVKDTYKKYLEKTLRKLFDIATAPIRIHS